MSIRLKELRTSLKLSQEEFGNKLHLQKGHISSMEKGTRNITDRTITDICRVFNVNEYWLRTGNGDMFNDTDLESLAVKINTLTDVHLEVIKLVVKLPPRRIKIISALAEELLELDQ